MPPKKKEAKESKDKKPKEKEKDKHAHDESHKEEIKPPDASADFEAGVMFNKYDKSKTGVVTADDFRQMWKEAKESLQKEMKVSVSAHPELQQPPVLSAAGASDTKSNAVAQFPASTAYNPSKADPFLQSFEAGQIFSHFDRNNDGLLDKKEFESLINQIPGLFKPSTSHVEAASKVAASSYPPSLPIEIISGRLLTHYDETAGIPLPKTSVDQHKEMGNLVTPLIEAYRTRYDRLRSLLTGKLLPKREHLLQIRRQLNNISEEVAASRRAIEKETIKDVEGILDRLRSVESLRQSSIKHQVLQVDEELGVIERVVRKVEQANEESVYNGSTGIMLTSAVPGTTPVEMVRAPRAQLMVELIQQFADISNNIEKLSMKPVSIQCDFPTDDFPKETAERLEIISRCDKYLHAMNVKDHICWTALQEKKKIEEQLLEEKKLCEEYAGEVAQWAEMSQVMAQQLHQVKEENKVVNEKNLYLIDILRKNNIFVS